MRPPKDQDDPVWEATVTTFPLVPDLFTFRDHLRAGSGQAQTACANRRSPHPTPRPITPDVRIRSTENALPTSLNKAILRLCVTETV